MSHTTQQTQKDVYQGIRQALAGVMVDALSNGIINTGENHYEAPVSLNVSQRHYVKDCGTTDQRFERISLEVSRTKKGLLWNSTPSIDELVWAVGEFPLNKSTDNSSPRKISVYVADDRLLAYARSHFASVQNDLPKTTFEVEPIPKPLTGATATDW